MHRYVILLSLLDKEPDSGSLQLLADFINNHIRFEERKLFVMLKKHLHQNNWRKSTKSCRMTCIVDTEWEDEFWVRK